MSGLRPQHPTPPFINDDDLAGDLYDSRGNHYVLIARVDYDKLAAVVKLHYTGNVFIDYTDRVIDAARNLVHNHDTGELDP